MDDFEFQPPEQTREEFNVPMNREAAWILQLIDIKLNKADINKDIRDEFINDIQPYIVNASMTQVRRGEVRLFLGIFEELWMEFKIFKFRKKNSPHLSYVKTLIEGYLMQNYNKSIDGWQGNHVFEKKHTYDVRQTNKDIRDEEKQGMLSRLSRNKNRKSVDTHRVEPIEVE